MNEFQKTIEAAEVVIITSGAGMGVDSKDKDGKNMPDFRGNEGMWKEYPALKKQNIDFAGIANPKQFKMFPTLAWAFYGHRFDMYKETTPNIGFDALRELVKDKKDYFVVTSNIDGHFQKAGFDTDKVYEVHGRINKFQCTECGMKPWDAPSDTNFNVDTKNFTVDMKDIPKCKCGAVARPNIMMFGDYDFDSSETAKQEAAFNKFMHAYDKNGTKIVVIEIGAGTAIPTIRSIGEYIHTNVESAQLIRINPRESFGPEGTMSIDKGGVDALQEILPEDVKKMFFIKP